MRKYVLLFTISLVACAHNAAPKPELAAAPLPALSVQRELELEVGYEGAPGTMQFLELHQEAVAQTAAAVTPKAQANERE